MKRALFSTAIISILASVSVPTLAQENQAETSSETAETNGAAGDDELIFLTEEDEELIALEREMVEAYSIFGDFFEIEPLTEAQEARLPIAQQMTDKIMPVGTFAGVLEDTMKPMLGAVLGQLTSDPQTQLSSITGMTSYDLAELETETLQDALDVFDPHLQERNDKTTDLAVNIVAKMFDAMEPFYREAMSKSLAVRFDEAEMIEVLKFFDTPVGEKFALSSFMVHYDPQMLGVMEQMGPAMMAVLPEMMEGFAELEENYPPARSFSELSAAERGRVSDLLGKPVTELDALEPQIEVENDDDVAEDAVS